MMAPDGSSSGICVDRHPAHPANGSGRGRVATRREDPLADASNAAMTLMNAPLRFCRDHRTSRASSVRRRGTNHPLWLIGILLCIFIAFQCQSTRYFGPLELAATSGGFLLSIALWVRYSRHRSFDFLDPIHLVMCILLVGFCGVLVYDPSVHMTVFAETSRALTVSIVATLAFALGYTAVTSVFGSYTPPQRLSLLRILHRVPRPEAPALLLGLWLLTFFWRLFYSLEHGYGTVFESPDTARANAANLIQTVGTLGRYFIFSALIIWLSRSRRFGRIQIWLALICLGLEVWITIASGWKSSPVLFAVGLLLVARARASCGKRIGVGTGLVAASCLLLILIVFYALDTYRSRHEDLRFSIATLAATSGEADTASIQRSLDRFVLRIGYGGFLADVIGVVDSGVLDRQHGATLWPGVLWFIPRAIWPTKPKLSIGGWYAVTVLGWHEGPEAAVTVPGDFYLNFGIAGVFGGMLAYGLLLRLLYDRLVGNGRTVLGQCLFVPIFLTFALTFEQNVSVIIGGACQLVCALAAVLLCVTTRPLGNSLSGRRIS